MDTFHLRQLGDEFLPFTFKGVTYSMAMISLGGRARIESLLRKVIPDPIALGREAAAGQPNDVARALMEKALYKRAFWPPSVESDEGIDAMMKHLDLQIAVLAEMLRFNHFQEHQAVAKEIADAIGLETFGKLLNFGWTGVYPGDPAPKAMDQPAPPIGNG